MFNRIVEPLKPVYEISFKDETPTPNAADREITWSLSTLYRSGAYNSSIPYGATPQVFSLWERYWKVRTRRVNSGAQLQLIQSNTNNGPAWAWSKSGRIWFSPTMNYGSSLYIYAKVLLHEVGHALGRLSHTNKPEALMSPNGGTSKGWVEVDRPWFNRNQLRSTMPPPGIIGQTFAAAAMYRENEVSLEQYETLRNFEAKAKIRLGCEKPWWWPFYG